jgi:iron complex outermembrane receptor protein
MKQRPKRRGEDADMPDNMIKLLAGVAALSLAPAVAAQTPAAADPSAVPGRADPAQSAALDDIVVTARRREEASQSVPLVIAAVSGADLTARSITNVDEIQFLVPTLRVTTSLDQGQGTSFALRGLRSTGVVTYFSQVPALGQIVGRELYDLGSVQVLKGPQGTLFGKNTSAGAILFEPARPTDEIEGFFEVKAGNYDQMGLQGMFNLPLSDTLQLRVAGQAEKRDGFTKIVGQPNGTNLSPQGKIDSASVRASLLFRPSDDLENLLVVDRFDAEESLNPPRLFRSIACPDNPGFVQLLIQGSCKYPGWDQSVAEDLALGPRKTNNPFQGSTLTKSWSVSNLTTYDVNDQVTVKNIFGYRRDTLNRRFDGDGTKFDLFISNNNNSYRFYSDEMQVQAEVGRLKLILGAFYSHNKIGYNDSFRVAVPGPLDPILRDGRTTETSKALFTQATFAATDRLNLTAGFRYTWEKKSVTMTDFGGGACSYAPGDANVDISTCTYDDTIRFREPSWTFSADYQLAPNSLLYATTRRGFNSGGINISPPIPYGTETIDDIEVGSKNDFRVGGLPVRLNVSAFRSQYKDIQRQITQFVDAQPKSYIQNAAKARVTGLEVEGQIRIGGLSLSENVTLLDAKYRKFETETAPGIFADLSDNKLSQAPKFTNTFTASYKLPVSEEVASDLSLSGTWAYQSKIYFSDFNQLDQGLSNTIDDTNYQTGYSIVNAQLVARNIGGTGLGASLFVKNLTNKTFSTSRSSALSSFGYATIAYGDPRTYGVTLSYRFGR